VLTVCQYEYLPATGAPEQELVLLHGWAGSRELWRPLLPYLRPWANVTLVDIPGCAPGAASDNSAPPELDAVLAAILECCPPRAVLLGFSLGGQLALRLAALAPERILAAITVCSNPCFVAAPDWPGMARATLDKFARDFAADPGATLLRFGALQVKSAARPQSLLRALRCCTAASTRGRADAAAGVLDAGLDWLSTLDLRASAAGLAQPQLHLLAPDDALVPAALEVALSRWLPAGAALRRLPEPCHLAPLTCPGAIAREVGDFLRAAGLRGGPSTAAPEPPPRCKAAVAASFSRAARDYDTVAGLQRDVGAHLLDSLDSVSIEPRTVLDLGCGTGFFAAELARRFPAARYLGLDLAEGMVDYARARCAGTGEWLVADAEALPLASGSVDLVFSSLAIQWCDRPRHLFAELARVLTPGGMCVFTSLGPRTLHELRAAWSAVDERQHVNAFLPAADLHSAARGLPGVRLDLDARDFNLGYARVRDLLHELKTLGAHNVNRGRPPGLTGRRALQDMLQAYEGWRRDGQLPATYEVFFGALEKA